MEMGPSLPINIVTMIRILPVTLSDGVIPMERPVVPKADDTSNKILRNGAPFSVTVSNAETATNHEMATRMMASALLMIL